MKAAVFDIDGTLAIQKGEGLNRFRDIPVEDIRELADIFSERDDYTTILLTARFEDVRNSTEEWLEKNQIDYDRLMMRPRDRFETDTEFKEEKLEELRSEGFDVRFAVEDLVSISDMWRENDVTCLQVAENSGGSTSLLRSLLGLTPSPLRKIYFWIHSSWYRRFRT